MEIHKGLKFVDTGKGNKRFEIMSIGDLEDASSNARKVDVRYKDLDSGKIKTMSLHKLLTGILKCRYDVIREDNGN